MDIEPGYRPSPALVRWRTVGQAEMDELLAAHRRMRGTDPGRRAVTTQIDHALVVQLAARFQRYSRDLHGLCITALVGAAPPAYRKVLGPALHAGRRLDTGNAQPGSVGGDFSRFGAAFWPSVDAVDPDAPVGRQRLEQLVIWRNAIAHQDFRAVATHPATVGTRVDLDTVLGWLLALTALVEAMDITMCAHVVGVTGTVPW